MRVRQGGERRGRVEKRSQNSFFWVLKTNKLKYIRTFKYFKREKLNKNFKKTI